MAVLPAMRFGGFCARVLPLVLMAGAGCGVPAESLKDVDRLSEIQVLQDKIQDQARLLARKDEQLRDQAGIIQSLRELQAARRLDALIHVERIEIDRLSGGYDDNRDGIDEGIRVYLRLYDQFNGALRATGKVRVRLYDLANPEGAHLVGEAEFEPEELAPLWYGRLLTSHYTFDVPWSGGAKAPAHRQITVVATFTDLLSGRTFEAQSVVEVSGAAASASAGPP